jgi:hypothetical protein
MKILTTLLGSASQFSAAHAPPVTLITSAPYTITVPGDYKVIAPLNMSGGPAITILASDVKLDLNKQTIAMGDLSSTAISINTTLSGSDAGYLVTAVRVTNGTITGGNIGILIYANDCVIDNLKMSGVHLTGVDIYAGKGNQVHHCNIAGPGDSVKFTFGVVVTNGTGNVIYNNTFSHWWGIFLEQDFTAGTGKNTFTGNISD